jgi:hypothetical protein
MGASSCGGFGGPEGFVGSDGLDGDWFGCGGGFCAIN